MASKQERGINVSAKNVFEVMRLILRSDQPIGVLEISRKLSLPPSSVHRALVSLEESRFATRGVDVSKYVPGPMFHHLLRAMLNRYAVRKEAYDCLHAIAEWSGQTTSLFVRLGWYTLLIATAEGSQEVCHARSAGEVMLLSDTPAGIAILSCMGEEDIASFRRFVAVKMPEHADSALSPKTDRLIEEAKTSKFTLSTLGEVEKRLVIAFPLRSANQTVWTSVTISGPAPIDETEKTPLPNSSVLKLIKRLEQTLEHDLDVQNTPFLNIPPDDIVLSTHQSRL